MGIVFLCILSFLNFSIRNLDIFFLPPKERIIEFIIGLYTTAWLAYENVETIKKSGTTAFTIGIFVLYS